MKYNLSFIKKMHINRATLPNKPAKIFGILQGNYIHVRVLCMHVLVVVCICAVIHTSCTRFLAHVAIASLEIIVS